MIKSMADKPKIELETFMKSRGNLEELANILDMQKDPRSAKKDEAEKSLRNLAHETAKKYIEGYNLSDASKMNEEMVQNAIQLYQTIELETAANTFSANIEKILNEQVDKSKLEKLLASENASKIILSASSDKGREVLVAYSNYKSLEDFVSRYESSGKASNEEERKIISLAALDGIRKIQEEKVKGYSNSVKKLSGNLAALALQQKEAIKDEEIKKYAIEGLKKQLDEAKAKYEEISTKKGLDAYGALTQSITKLAKGEREEFEQAMQLVYIAQSGKLDKS